MTTTNIPNDTLWKFPCDFPIKVFGKANTEFESFALSTIRKHFPDILEGAIELRPSKDGHYLAVTVTVKASSREQLDAVYIELSASKLVLAAL